MITAEDNMLSVFYKKRVMFFLPHEDDEVNTAGTLLIQFEQFDVDCRVVYSTNGELYINPARRIKEAKKALKTVGINEDDIVFLGFPDVNSIDKILSDSEEQIQKIIRQIDDFKPDYIICNDRDSHPNHVELSILINKAVGKLLSENNTYRPLIFKTYAYNLAYFSDDDYSAYNLKSTVKPELINNPMYIWEERLRLPVSKSARSKSIECNKVYKMLWKHHSQSAFRSASRVANSDKVYWTLRTDSLSYRATFTASSGEVKWLNDFEFNNIKSDMTIDQKALWHPSKDDKQRTIKVTLDKPHFVSKMVLFENNSLVDNILKADIKLSDGNSYTICEFNHSGGPTEVFFEKNGSIEWIEMQVLEYEGENFGINEIQVFEEKSSEIWFAKICIDGDFVYDYYTDKDTISPNVVAYNKHGDLVDVGKRCKWIYNGQEVDGSSLRVSRKKTSILQLEIMDIPNVTDRIRIIRMKGIDKYERMYRIISSLLRAILLVVDWVVNEIYIVRSIIAGD